MSSKEGERCGGPRVNAAAKGEGGTCEMRTLVIGLAALALTACGETPGNELAGRWEVQQIAGASLGEGVDIWIEFDPAVQSAHGFTGCNDFTTTVAAYQASIAFAPLQEAAGECPSEAAAVDEERFLRVMPAVQRYILRGNSLELLQPTSGSETLVRLRRVEG
jgi:heat shock protein HslJ